MKVLKFLGALTVGSLLSAAASAQTVVRWLHIEPNPGAIRLWEETARDFEAKNPGVKIEMSFLENEAFKARLPTMLQSRDKPHIIYSWAGGVLKAQVEAGVLEEITPQVREHMAGLAPGAVGAFTLNGRIWGVPHAVSQVGFMYNKELMTKAGVDGDAIKTWDAFLDAVRKLKAAGITPIMVGGGDKWPLHFYWTHLAVRLGGKPAFEAALRGENGGFEGPVFQRAGDMMKELVDLQPFQNGFLGTRNPQAVGAFGDGRAAMILAISSFYATQRALSANKEGIPDDKLGWFNFPAVPGGQGLPTDTLGGVNGWLVTKGAPPQAAEFLKHFVSAEVQTRLAAGGFLIPVAKGADTGLRAAFLQNIARNIGASTYHQNFYDQDLGPSVGRVVNDATSELAGGTMNPRQVAKAIQDAFRQGN
ncbi:MAG: extracellular solute-binding protein [Hyphomicrobiales bacterium]|nr:extracellular solute-binding protein [Hyphomicrobiales bacterium]